MTDPRKMELAYRLVNAGRDWLTPIASLGAFLIRRKDENTAITPEENKTKPAALIISATEEGRTVSYAPIRNLRLELSVRANAKLASGQEEAFHGSCGALETLLDSGVLQADPASHFVTLLSPAKWALYVMLAVRRQGVGEQTVGDLRIRTWTIDVKAVKAENTTQG